jgi:hypothetical protein
MEILINRIKDYSKKEQTIVIRKNGISLIDGNSCYEKLLSKDVDFIGSVENKLAQIMFGWKDEYVGNRSIDGERYHIVVDINHKKKKYKIQNKFPDNWEEFLELQRLIMESENYD